MENTFVPGLINLRNSGPDEVIEKLHATFLSIATMDANEVVAAYQTLMTVTDSSGLRDDPMVSRLEEAMVNQMVGLAANNGLHHLKRFARVTDRTTAFSLRKFTEKERNWDDA